MKRRPWARRAVWIAGVGVGVAALVGCGRGCDRGTPGAGSAEASASVAATPAPAPPAPPAALGEPCGARIARACAAGLTCVVESGDVTACLALPVGGVCGVFQCKAGEACCDPDGNACSAPGAECTPRAEAGRRGTICRRDDPGGCDPLLRCEHPEKAAFGVCVDR